MAFRGSPKDSVRAKDVADGTQTRYRVLMADWSREAFLFLLAHSGVWFRVPVTTGVVIPESTGLIDASVPFHWILLLHFISFESRGNHAGLCFPWRHRVPLPAWRRCSSPSCAARGLEGFAFHQRAFFGAAKLPRVKQNLTYGTKSEYFIMLSLRRMKPQKKRI